MRADQHVAGGVRESAGEGARHGSGVAASVWGVARVVASPMKMSETPPIARTAPPTLGQHSDDILRERLGFDDARIEQLRAEGVV